MAGGTWNITEDKIRPGLFINFKAAAIAQIARGERGIVAMPVRTDWGPVKQFVTIETEKQLVDTFSDRETGTALFSIRQALKGGTKKVLAYRLAGASAKKATLTLKDTSNADALKLTAKYEGARGNDFKVTVQPNIVDNTKKDLKVFEKTVFIKAYTATSNAEFIRLINADSDALFTAEKLTDTALGAVAGADFTSGDGGLTVTNTDYIDAMDAFEAQQFNVFVLDGVTDPALQASTKDWVKRLRNEGKKVTLVIGGSVVEDQDVVASNARSKNCNHEGIVNLISGVKIYGKEYSSAQFAPRIAGMIAGNPINKSITYAQIYDIDDVTKRLTNAQIEAALKAGSLVLVHDGEKVKVERGINTLTNYAEEQNERFSKIRVIRTLDAISDDITKTGNDQYIGKLDNNEDGQRALISAIKYYLETLAIGKAISKTHAVELSKDLVSKGDKVYLDVGVDPTDSMEFIFLNVVVN